MKRYQFTASNMFASTTFYFILFLATLKFCISLAIQFVLAPSQVVSSARHCLQARYIVTVKCGSLSFTFQQADGP